MALVVEGSRGPAHAADELWQLRFHAAAPGGHAQLGRACPPPRESALPGALIAGLQHLLHHRLARADLRLGREVLLEPGGHALLLMKTAQTVLSGRQQGGIGV